MADDHSQVLEEAYSRGIMPPDMKTAYEEAKSRGLLGASSAPVGQDIVSSIAAAPRKVAEGLIGLPGTMRQGVGAAMDYLTGTPVDATPKYNILPTPQDIQAQTSKAIGPSYQPQTTPGKYAGMFTEGAVGALAGPGSIMSKLLIGGASGLGSEAAQQYAPDHPIIAGLLGGVGGGAAAIAGGKGLQAVRNYASAKSAGSEIGDILGTQPPPPGAVRRVAKSAADDQLTVPGAVATQAALGSNDAMVMDLGRQLQGRAEQMAVQPGAAQNMVLNAVEGRTGQYGSGTAERVAKTLDSNLGPSQDVVQLIDRVNALVQKEAGPAYKSVMDANPHVDVPAEITSRPVIQTAMSRAENLAKNYGDPLKPTTQTQTVLSGPGYHIAEDVAQPPPQSLKYWDYVKKSLDQRINTMMRSGIDDLSSAEKSDLGGLINAKQALVSHLDAKTGGKYAEARAIASTKPELHEALDFGRSIFNSKLLPEEVSAQITDMSLPAREMAKVGARRELERVLGNVRNEGAKARAFLDTNNNSAKISALFGPDAAEAISNRVAAENTFQQATENIARNSRTAVRQELAKDTANPLPGDYHATLTGYIGAPIKSGLAYALQHGMENTRSGISNILTAKEQQLPAVVEQLLGYNKARAAHQTAPTSQQLKTLARALMSQQLGQ